MPKATKGVSQRGRASVLDEGAGKLGREVKRRKAPIASRDPVALEDRQLKIWICE